MSKVGSTETVASSKAQMLSNAQAANGELEAMAALFGVGKGKLLKCLLGAVKLKDIIALLRGGDFTSLLDAIDIEKIIACLFPPDDGNGTGTFG